MAVKWVGILLLIRELAGLDVGPETDYRHSF
jgi:hypothetical protein